MTIDVIFALGPGSKPFASLSQQLMSHLESGKHQIRYRGILGGALVEVDNVEVIASVARQAGPGDMTHSAVLDEMMNHVEADYTVITDSDVAILHQDWDDVCVREIVDDVAAIGFQIPDERCRTFPCVRFCMFDSAKLLECQPSFTPKLTNGPRAHPTKEAVSSHEAKHLGRTIVYKDTGWKMPVFFHERGYRGLVMQYYQLHQTGKCKIPPLNEQQRKRMKGRILGHEEYHWKGELFATHKGQVKRGFRRQELWESRVIAYAKEHFGCDL